MGKQTETTPDEFPVTLDEFLSEIPSSKVEMKAGFCYLCRTERIAGAKSRQEWRTLLDRYNTMPVNKTWSEWTKGGK